VAYMSAHPGVLRRLGFAIIEYHENKDECGSYGKCDFGSKPACDVWFPGDKANEQYGDIVTATKTVKGICESILTNGRTNTNEEGV